jgi:DNA-binding transcriptional LysR family regulator
MGIPLSSTPVSTSLRGTIAHYFERRYRRPTTMELRQLAYFVTLAEQLHFARAAEILDLAPSALTMQLQALERSLGVRLVNRTKRSVALTAAGSQFLVEARATLAQAEHAKTTARRAGRGELGTVRMAYVFSAACAGVVQRLLGAYHKMFPEMTLALSELESPEQIRQLLTGALDACVVRTVTGDPDAVESLPLLTENIVIALAPDHPRARQSVILARELTTETFIAPQFQHETGFGRHLLSIGNQAGFTPEVSIQTRDFLTTLALVGAGLGIAAVPQSLLNLHLPNVLYRKLADVNETSTLFLVFRRGERSAAIAQLRRIAIAEFNISE